MVRPKLTIWWISSSLITCPLTSGIPDSQEFWASPNPTLLERLKLIKMLAWGVSICLDMVSIETLDLDSSKTEILTFAILLTLQKWCLDMSRKSWHFKKPSLDTLDALKQCFTTFLSVRNTFDRQKRPRNPFWH